MSPLKIAMIASECVPFAKTGGLADVVGSLPAALQRLGHEVIVVMPKYQSISLEKYGIRRYWDSLGVWMGTGVEWCAIDVGENQGVPVYFVEHQRYFDRPGYYNDANYNDYGDNPFRFGFLTRAGLQLCRDMGFAPDIVHTHDWHTALAAAYLKVWHWNDPVLGGAASVLTIHNAAYQGRYDSFCYPYLGLGWQNFRAETLEDFGAVNFLKGGIVYSDVVNTVSPTYAEETRSGDLGFGMGPYLDARGENYVGIINGVDYAEWSPEADRYIPETYSAESMEGKVVCKRALQERFGLEVSPEIPIVGIVSRFADQKGLDLLAAVIESIVDAMHVQFVILGSGDPVLQNYFGALPARFPGRIGCYIGYSNELAHLIEAGSDFFLMPSIYEPCGLNQIYSLRYGTLPIVRATGGLEDTVIQYDEEAGTGTGFKFWEASGRAVYYAVGWAVSTWYDRPQHIAAMVRQAMAQDYSWERSAEQYVALYERARRNKAR